MGIPDHLTCLLRNLYAVQEATVRTGHEITDWFQTGKGVLQGWAKMNSYIFNQLQLVSYSYLNHVVVNCFPISFLDGFNFLVLKALLKTVITTLNLFIQTKLLTASQFSNS